MYYLSINKNDYSQMCEKHTPPTKFIKSLPMAFLIGGAICSIGQLLIFFYQFLDFPEKDAYALSSCTIIFITAILTGLNVFDDIASIAGAGTLVPITGFANSVASPALEFKAEGFLLGVGAKMFVIAGPVIVYGELASVIYGIIIFLFNM